MLLSDILNLSARDLKVVVTYEKTLNKRQDNKRRALLRVASEEKKVSSANKSEAYNAVSGRATAHVDEPPRHFERFGERGAHIRAISFQKRKEMRA